MNNALSDIAITIASPLFSLALFLIAMRFLAQLCSVSPYNPISVGIRKATDPIVAPINRSFSGQAIEHRCNRCTYPLPNGLHRCHVLDLEPF